ncbi:MAG TPA: hypothetical protein VIU93_01775 [Gallionellaceae bacterium]
MRKHYGWLIVILCALVTACATDVSSIETQGGVYRIAVPTTAWAMEFPSEGFKLEQADNSRPYYFLTNGRTGLSVSFNFEHATKCNDSESCRDYFSEKLKAGFPGKKNWRSSRIGDVYVSENMDGPVSGFNLKQQHMNAHFVKEGVWVDMHISKVNYREADRELFLDFVRSVRFRQKT